MNKGKQKLSLICDGVEVNKIESFVDSVCEEYNVYNNYFGNMVISLVSIHDECRRRKGDEAKMDLEFFSDSKGLNFRVDPHNEKMIDEAENALKDENILLSDNNFNWLFLIKKLCDELYIERSNFILEYDVASINRDLAASRVSSLRAYFKGEKIEDNYKYN